MNHQFREVISKFIPGDQPQVLAFEHNLTIDQTNILTNGPFADRIKDKVWPKYNKKFRSEANMLHHDLVKLERKYSEYRDKPKSIMLYKQLIAHYQEYERDLRYPKWKPQSYEDWLSSISLDVRIEKSTNFKFDTTGLDLTTGSGLPQMGAKKLRLNHGLQYADKIKSDQSTAAFMFLPGYRTQVDKTRGIWQDPISEWVLEVEAFRDAIRKAVVSAKTTKQVRFFYCTPQQLHEFIFSHSWSCALVLDYRMFDTGVTAFETDDVLRLIAGDYVAIDHIIDHANRAPIQMPNGIIYRYGGLASGKIFTNYGDGAINLRDTVIAITVVKFDKWIVAIVVNGDDILVLFKTIITEENLQKIAKHSTRTLEPDKCWVSSDSVWFSKVFYCREYYCKPAYLVLHSCIYRERDPIEGVLGKGYLAVATAQKCEWLKDHPFGETVVKWIKAEDKYPIESMDDSIVKPALDLYARRNSYLKETGQLDELYQLPDKSFYASV